ncbi:MAG: hypothetical protein U9N50_05725 [Pseudomonadota bacterium]|nr:hypothetical protein [Pseudomonadota bacterium]
MLKYLFGILLVQIATVALVLLASPDLQGQGLLRLIIPLVFIGFVAAFWFSSLAHHLRKDHLFKANENFAKEREKINVNAERAKARVMKQAQKDVAKEAKVAHAKANFKVGATFAAAIGAGALMLMTQFLTIGIVLLATSGGALAGYLYRGRNEDRAVLNSDDSPNIIEVNPKKKILPKV